MRLAGNTRQVFRKKTVEGRSLRREQRDQRIVACLADCGVQRSRAASCRHPGVALVTANDRIYGIEHRDVNDRHRPGRAGRAKLFAENPRLSRRDGRVIEPAGIDRDLVPTMQRIQAGARPMDPLRILIRPKSLAESIWETLSLRHRDEHIGVFVGFIQIVGGEYVAAGRHLKP